MRESLSSLVRELVGRMATALVDSLSSSLIIHLRPNWAFFLRALNQLLAFHTYQNSLTLLVKLFSPSSPAFEMVSRLAATPLALEPDDSLTHSRWYWEKIK